MKQKPDAVEKLALQWVIDGHESGGATAIRSLIRREVKAERERCLRIIRERGDISRFGLVKANFAVCADEISSGLYTKGPK